MKLRRADFPTDFMFGAATAAYQIEGHSFGGAGPTHWDTFSATPGNVVGAENGAIACDHYHRMDADLDLLSDAGMDAYRFSTSWARVLPDGRGTPNQDGLDFYDRLVDGCMARGLKPFQTLYHWEMPSALADLGGWTNPDVADWMADYAEVITRRIGDRVHSIATLNEPWCVSYLSHFLGHHAPGLRDIRATARAMHHVNKAHGRTMTRLRDMGQDTCGIVLNFEATQAASDISADRRAAATQDATHNRWFIEAIAKGHYPAEALDGLEPHLPANWQDDMAEISQPIDFLGVNYYTRGLVQAVENAPWPATAPVGGPLDKTQMGWEIYPQGLQDTLIRMAKDYVGTLPMFVTENGMAWPETDGHADDARTGFIDSHLQAMHAAIGQGVNLQGFFYWSLLDNYEWAFGYEKRFGLVHVDFDTLDRTPKSSYHALKTAIARQDPA
ncbi:GH1 family beta-glucosidase [Loktanella sp. SALINAS62]|uniref:GH1 family beta-glucosidase n=1 Tax=Loktanella sp. SALINAS62 TaxID=2706124 RepID=UPI001B8DA4B6|nr:GH1 family beta-glucosidase [Loktanella sp. SALINAS62]MBS1303749.1 beta-glucosidase [Loktanella sp. SALINAS62]